MSLQHTLKDNLEESLRMGMTELLILNLLNEKERYGYEIRQVLQERTHNVFSYELESSIYGPLRRLEERKLISSHSETVKGKRIRRYYHIEKEGIDYLEYGRNRGRIICTEFLNNINYDN